jgi:hypothetical protein
VIPLVGVGGFVTPRKLFVRRLERRTKEGVTQLRCFASQSRTFACGSMVLVDHGVRFFRAPREKPHTNKMQSTALPKA